jgi:hypothetical protein
MKIWIALLVVLLLSACATVEYVSEDAREWVWVWENCEGFQVVDAGNGYYFFRGYGRIPPEMLNLPGQI